jgi:hypothetical protein
MIEVLFAVAALAAPPLDYAGAKGSSYDNFLVSIESGVGQGKLAVGVPDPWVNTFENHCWVKSLTGVKPGLYDCYRDKSGKAVMIPWSPPKAMERPVISGIQETIKYCTKNGCYTVPK